jgi:hypothetical protein
METETESHFALRSPKGTPQGHIPKRQHHVDAKAVSVIPMDCRLGITTSCRATSPSPGEEHLHVA